MRLLDKHVAIEDEITRIWIGRGHFEQNTVPPLKDISKIIDIDQRRGGFPVGFILVCQRDGSEA